MPKKNIAQLFYVSSLCLLTVFTANGQSLSEFEAWKKQQMGEFKQYKDEIDREFADFLKQRWKAFDSLKGAVRDPEPKPLELPVAKPEEVKKPQTPVEKPIPPVVVKPPVKLPPPAPVILPEIPDPVIQPPTQKTISVTFLGYHLQIADGLSNSISSLSRPINFHKIQQQFSDLASSDFSVSVDNLNRLRRELKLNDWAYVQLVESFTEKLVTSPATKKLASWFLLLKSGLDARVAYDPNKIFLLVATEQKLFDIAYIQYGNQKYYSVGMEKKLPQQLFSYDGKYPKKLAVSNVALVDELNARPVEQTRNLKFSYKNKTYHLKLPYNRNTVDFLSSYPQMEIDQYFRAPLDHSTSQAILKQLQPVVAGMGETDAVNLLLKFVQTAFKYETDQQQFGHENYMFMEETFYYPASDCEDRSILFAWLVKNLLGLKVVGLDFPGHVATAVALSQPTGETIRYRGVQYTIADPTYINAVAGMKMPQFKNVTPRVISAS